MADVRGGSEQIEGTRAIDTAAGDNPVQVGGYASTAAPTAVGADGRIQAVWVDRNGRVQIGDGGGSLTVDGAVTVSGTATVSGTVSIDNITTAIVPGTGATNLGKAEDAAAASGDTGVGGLSVRNDNSSASYLAGTDGDYQMLQSSSDGSLKVIVTGGIQKTDKSTFTEGTTTFVPVGGEFKDAGTGPADGQQAACRITGSRALHAHLRDASGVEALVPGTGATHLGKAEDAAHTSGDTGLMPLAVRQDADASLVNADLDYAPFQVHATGALKTVLCDRQTSGSISTPTGSVTLNVAGMSTAIIYVEGTWTGNIQWAGAGGGNGTFPNIGMPAESLSGGTRYGSVFFNGVFVVNVAGWTQLKVYGNTVSSGTALIDIRASTGVRPLSTFSNAAYTAGDPGVTALAVRKDTRGTLALADGEYGPPQMNASGDTRVEISDIITSGTIISGGGSVSADCTGRGTATIELTGTWVGTLVFALGTDTGGLGISVYSQLTNAMVGTATANGSFIVNCAGYTNIQIAPVAWTSGTVTVTVRAGAPGGVTRVLSIIPGTGATNLGKAEDAAHTSGDVGVMSLAVRNDTRGTLVNANLDYGALQLNANGELRVDAGGFPTSTVTSVDLLSANDATRVLTLLAANTSRRGAVIANDTDAALLIKEGSGASLTSYSDLLPPGCRYVLDYPQSTSILTAYLPAVPSGRILVTERT